MQMDEISIETYTGIMQESFTILTTEANDLMATIHNLMPMNFTYLATKEEVAKAFGTLNSISA